MIDNCRFKIKSIFIILFFSILISLSLSNSIEAQVQNGDNYKLNIYDWDQTVNVDTGVLIDGSFLASAVTESNGVQIKADSKEGDKTTLKVIVPSVQQVGDSVWNNSGKNTKYSVKLNENVTITLDIIYYNIVNIYLPYCNPELSKDSEYDINSVSITYPTLPQADVFTKSTFSVDSSNNLKPLGSNDDFLEAEVKDKTIAFHPGPKAVFKKGYNYLEVPHIAAINGVENPTINNNYSGDTRSFSVKLSKGQSDDGILGDTTTNSDSQAWFGSLGNFYIGNDFETADSFYPLERVFGDGGFTSKNKDTTIVTQKFNSKKENKINFTSENNKYLSKNNQSNNYIEVFADEKSNDNSIEIKSEKGDVLGTFSPSKISATNEWQMNFTTGNSSGISKVYYFHASFDCDGKTFGFSEGYPEGTYGNPHFEIYCPFTTEVVNPLQNNTSISINPSSTSMNVGETKTFTANVSPSSLASEVKTFEWELNDTNLARIVNKSGNSCTVKALKKGLVTLTVKGVENDKSNSSIITINSKSNPPNPGSGSGSGSGSGGGSSNPGIPNSPSNPPINQEESLKSFTVNSEGTSLKVSPQINYIDLETSKNLELSYKVEPDNATVTATCDSSQESSSKVTMTQDKTKKVLKFNANGIEGNTAKWTVKAKKGDKEISYIVVFRLKKSTSTPNKPTTPDKPSEPSQPSKPSNPSNPSSPTAPSVESAPVYRLYNEKSGEHLYTSDKNENDILVRDYGWTAEGDSWTAPKSGTPVYRLYNPDLADHLYTTDTNEMNVLTTERGWSADNNGQPLFYSGGSVPIYRVYHEEIKRHLLTKDKNEYNILGSQGWIQEGIKLNSLS